MERGIEVNLVQIRNDKFKVFKNFQNIVPNMDWLENKYLYLPINTQISKNQIENVISTFNEIINNI